MTSTVGVKGQVTIPKRLRDRLGLRPGTRLDFEEKRGLLSVRKCSDARVERAFGILPRFDVDAYVRDARGREGHAARTTRRRTS